jgi:hypothetical protein
MAGLLTKPASQDDDDALNDNIRFEGKKVSPTAFG